MKAKNKPIIYSIVLITLLCIIVVTAIFLYKPLSAKSKPTVQTDVTGEYIIGVYQEKIAVFTQGDRLPIEIFDVYVSTLPALDQKELLKGIKVTGRIELKQRIEDYTS